MVTVIRVGEDNFSYLVDCGDARVAIDPGSARPVLDALKGRTLDAILLTHHHPDHSGGVRELIAECGCQVIDTAGGERVKIERTHWRVIATPGHTKDSVCFYCEEQKILFTGDTLFHSGIGRLIEGDAGEMYLSLAKLRELPPETRVYVGHDYTADNVAFGLSIMPDHAKIRARSKSFATGCSLTEELAANLFLQTDDPELARALNLTPDPVAVLAELRRLKDIFG